MMKENFSFLLPVMAVRLLGLVEMLKEKFSLLLAIMAVRQLGKVILLPIAAFLPIVPLPISAANLLAPIFQFLNFPTDFF